MPNATYKRLKPALENLSPSRIHYQPLFNRAACTRLRLKASGKYVQGPLLGLLRDHSSGDLKVFAQPLVLRIHVYIAHREIAISDHSDTR